MGRRDKGHDCSNNGRDYDDVCHLGKESWRCPDWHGVKEREDEEHEDGVDELGDEQFDHV